MFPTVRERTGRKRLVHVCTLFPALCLVSFSSSGAAPTSIPAPTATPSVVVVVLSSAPGRRAFLTVSFRHAALLSSALEELSALNLQVPALAAQVTHFVHVGAVGLQMLGAPAAVALLGRRTLDSHVPAPSAIQTSHHRAPDRHSHDLLDCYQAKMSCTLM